MSVPDLNQRDTEITRRWLALAVLALPTLLVSMDLSVLVLALPTLARDLSASGVEALWITDIYGFVIAGLLIVMGVVGDRIGRRRLLILGAIAFGATSLLAALSTSAEMLIAARALQGVAGATLMPSTLALIRTIFTDARERTLAISVWATCFSVGAVLGPLVAGVLLARFDWGSVFLINLPLMALLVAVAPRLLPESKATAVARLDLLGAGVLVITMLTAVYAIKHAAREGLTAAVLVAAMLAAVMSIAFVVRQITVSNPLLDLSLFRAPAFSVSLITNLTLGVCMAGIYLLTARFLQLVVGLSALETALWMLPQTVVLIVMSLLTSRLLRHFRLASVVAAGLVIAAVGMLIVAQAEPSAAGIAPVVLGTSVMALGFAPVGVLGPDLILATAPAGDSGAAAALSETGNELGNAGGIAVLGSASIAMYQWSMRDAPLDGLDGQDAALVAGSFEEGLRLAGGRPEVLNAVIDSYVTAMSAVATSAAGAVVLLAIAAFLLLRGVRRES
ncbi:MFS transporter [Aeromicrobium phragmitis]|uniref:MFS transporter n=1 Tax=Aeromicrobium phragmitis TaxID=2478914 RepID=A0A3L8PJS8_9ACTN|nr:MFS transporter [Aeromicrobium phragmitis]RLV54963.1 MFS transporter [Aeromicrobium phragmitis]